jgi:hypothetical protein
MKLIVSRSDGGVSVFHINVDLLLVLAKAPDHADTILGAEVAQWETSQNVGADSWRVADEDAVPADRTFRDAWFDHPVKVAIDVDMVKAREIHRANLRVLRKPLLEALDVEISRAFKDPAQQDAIEAKRQALRDVTAHPAIEAAATPEQLKAVLPAALASVQQQELKRP